MNNDIAALPLPSPDFDSLKARLKTFMSAHPELKDYDFNGSTLSVVLDTLSYNSHLNAFWLNMVGNEAFIKNAIKRYNVVSGAREMGYSPTTAKSAHTSLYLEYARPGEAVSSIMMPAGTSFTSSANSVSYTFNVLDDTSIEYDYSRGLYVADDVKVYEGRLLVHEWTVVAEEQIGVPNTVKDVTIDGVSIPNLNVDSSVMKVYVLDSKLGENFIQFSEYDNSLTIDKNTNMYFTSEDELGLVNITFGDGVLGYKPAVGSKIKIVYLISSGPGANGIGVLSQSSEFELAKLRTIIPKYSAGGGSWAESINSIKYNAQLSYESQGKAVLSDDYEYLVRREYPNAKKVITWGGQDNNPPQFGKIFISIQPQKGLTVTKMEKNEIIEKISKKNITTITPVIIDPDDIYIDLTVNLNYIPDSNISSGRLESLVIASVKKFAEVTLDSFSKNLEYSRLLNNIDNASQYISSNITDVLIAKRLNVFNQKQNEYSLDFGNKLVTNSIQSTPFKYSSYDMCYFEANGNKLQIVTTIFENQVNRKIIVVSDAGVIDYEKGLIGLRSLTITPNKSFFDIVKNNYYVKITAKPASNNVESKRNQILNIDNIKIIQKKVG